MLCVLCYVCALRVQCIRVVLTMIRSFDCATYDLRLYYILRYLPSLRYLKTSLIKQLFAYKLLLALVIFCYGRCVRDTSTDSCDATNCNKTDHARNSSCYSIGCVVRLVPPKKCNPQHQRLTAISTVNSAAKQFKQGCPTQLVRTVSLVSLRMRMTACPVCTAITPPAPPLAASSPTTLPCTLFYIPCIPSAPASPSASPTALRCVLATVHN